MTPELRSAILKAQREMRCAEGHATPQDIAIQHEFDDMHALQRFAYFDSEFATGHEIEPEVEWGEAFAVARFKVDGHVFIVRKEGTEFVLTAGDEDGQ